MHCSSTRLYSGRYEKQLTAELPVQQCGPAVIKSADGRSNFTGVVVAVAVNQLLSQAAQRAHLLMPWQHFRLQPLYQRQRTHVVIFSYFLFWSRSAFTASSVSVSVENDRIKNASNISTKIFQTHRVLSLIYRKKFKILQKYLIRSGCCSNMSNVRLDSNTQRTRIIRVAWIMSFIA